MNKAKVISSLLAMFISLPIWFYLLYVILEAINASELAWFLYWVYIPAGFLANFISKIAES